ncbi:class I SAM-dependent methyltransferase [Dongia sp.]|uniref:class I SAM-dependent methyltransferase n=1 Tax=Dongia sp. TaxID=1977262 RepID=UPI00374FE1E9
MTVGLSFKTDWNQAAGDYAKHRAGFPDWFFDRIEASGLFRPGMRVLDLATGTGTLARGFARRGGIVTGLDIAPEMMAQAKALDAEAGVSVDYVQAKAETTGQPAAHFDLISAGTCWFWFDGDLAAAEAKRVLKSGGHLMIAMLAWLPLAGNVVAATERLIEKHNPAWTLGNYHAGGVRYMRDLANAGFGSRESFSVDYDIPYGHEAWRGRIRASAGVSAASLSPEKVAAFDAEHAAMLSRGFPDDPMQVPHRVVASWGRKL